MTKKYEKFEEWMVGRAVKETNGDVGVVTRVYEYSDAAVWVDWGNFGGNLWIDVEDLEFIEEAPTKEEDVSIPWEEGQVVWDLLGGKGKVVCVDGQDSYPVRVVFDDGERRSYTAGGELYISDEARRLFFSEPTIIADTMPPKKPFVPKLKEGDKVVLSDEEADYIANVVREDEWDIYYKTLDGVVTSVAKHSAKVFKLGEEIKWES